MCVIILKRYVTIQFKTLINGLTMRPIAFHVEMMGLIGMGNNPMVGCTVAVAVAVEEGMNK